jgi:phosphatidylserine/phosphatidylglycerophosphate/cardiolipin synthase-like enzyme
MGAQIGSVTGTRSLFIGAVFPDGVVRIPSAWMQSIADALAILDPTSSWSTLLDLFPHDERRLIVLDHAGRPADGVQFQIRRIGDTDPRWTRALPPGVFDLEQAVAADPLDGISSLFTQPAGQELEVRAVLGSIPVQSILEHANDPAPVVATSVGDEYVRIPRATGAARLHLQVADLGSWFPPASTTPTSIERFHRHSRLEPLVDGIPAFKAIVADLNRAKHLGHGAQFTGWAFNRFALDADDGHDIIAIAQGILAKGGDVRLLATKFVQDEENFNNFSDPFLVIPALILFHAAVATDLLAPLFMVHQRPVFIIAGTATGFTIAGLAPLIPRIVAALENSSTVLGPMNDLTNGGPAIAIISRNPARLRDNPTGGTDLPLNLDAVTDHFGVWHNKSQMVKFQNASGHTEYSAFVGGMDINENRLDTPDHNAASPYHDIHCRLTGPVVRDAWISFNERWDFDRTRAGTTLDPITAPVPAELASQPECHLARIGRTYFGPNPDGNSTPLPFSPQGERSIFDTLRAAIGNAQRSIFIGEQYFTSEGSVNPPHPGEGSYHAALLNAASAAKRLVIVFPFEGDQPWGERRRRRLVSELREAWGSRMQVGFLQRRPSMPGGKTVAAVGRTRLLQDVGPTDTRFRIGPDARVPKTPFWMWIDGEMMLIHSTTRLQGSGPKDFVTEVDVLRTTTPGVTNWLSTPRPHKAGAPVTHARLGSIYVHSKVMVVDDLFVSIGSANLNRRGFFFDGEINAFAVPERLAASRDNPARALRTACWAQYLGIPPGMGEALLGDPIGDADFLLRSPFLGNRFTPLEAVDLKGQLRFVGDTQVADGGDMMRLFLEFAGLAVTEAKAEELFNQVFDATSFVDPDRIIETF